jgi:hypothetical protein
MAQSFFIPDNLREQLLKRNEASITTKSGTYTITDIKIRFIQSGIFS